MKTIILLLIFFSSLVSWAQNDSCSSPSSDIIDNPLGKNEGFPWPWSYQCEFDWNKITGKWKFKYNDSSEVEYTMEVFNLNQSGENILMVVQYDEKNEIIARGLALPTKHQRGIMVPMQWSSSESDGINGYWIHLSWVVDGSFTKLEAEAICQSDYGKTQLEAKITAFGHNQDERPPKTLQKVVAKAP